VKAAKDLGAGAYIKKPYVLAKLGLAVKQGLEKQQTGRGCVNARINVQVHSS
jgi:hypothetical protein